MLVSRGMSAGSLLSSFATCIHGRSSSLFPLSLMPFSHDDLPFLIELSDLSINGYERQDTLDSRDGDMGKNCLSSVDATSSYCRDACNANKVPSGCC